jgi:hypothetical protein
MGAIRGQRATRQVGVIFARSANDLDPVIVTLFPDALSRVLTAPDHRRRGLGSAMVGEAMAHSFREHEVNPD